MKITRVELARFKLPLVRRYRAGRVDIDAREGRVVRLTAENGTVGYGEIAPLPGLHKESLADADRVFRTIAPGLAGKAYTSFDACAQNIANRVAACATGGAIAAPSVVHGLQTAGLALFAAAADTTPAAILNPAPRDRVLINALFMGASADAAEAVATGRYDAYSCVKVKVGAHPIPEDRDIIRILLAGLPDATTLRLDANRGLSLEDATKRFSGLPPERIEYLEEPLANPVELADLSARTGLTIGLDETLHEPAHFDIGRASYVSAWCIKPSLIGHWQRMVFLANEAERYGSTVVVSSCLDTGLGLWAQAQIAAALPGRTAAAGLGTEAWLRLDTVTPRYDSSKGMVRICDWQGAPSARVLEKLQFRTAS